MTSGRVLVTGANGFLGRALVDALRREGTPVRAAVRSVDRRPPDVDFVAVGDIGPETDWGPALAGVDRVFHLAGRAHVAADGDENAFDRVNARGTAGLARAAADAGIRRFVYVSTVGVHGVRSPADRPLTESSPIAPAGPYARSKWAGEESLRAAARPSGLEIVVFRPPLVYGPGAPGNFARLLRWARSGVPLPLASLSAPRAFVFVGNLVSALMHAARHPHAAGKSFLISDGRDLSTAGFVREMRAVGVPARLVPFPEAGLRFLARCVGRSADVEKMAAPLALDIGAFCRALDWRPPFTVRDGLRRSCGALPRGENRPPPNGPP